MFSRHMDKSLLIYPPHTHFLFDHLILPVNVYTVAVVYSSVVTVTLTL